MSHSHWQRGAGTFIKARTNPSPLRTTHFLIPFCLSSKKTGHRATSTLANHVACEQLANPQAEPALRLRPCGPRARFKSPAATPPAGSRATFRWTPVACDRSSPESCTCRPQLLSFGVMSKARTFSDPDCGTESPRQCGRIGYLRRRRDRQWFFRP